MARPMRMKDKKNYMKRCRSSHSGESTGKDLSDESKYLIMKYDRDHGITLSPDKIKFMEEYEKSKMIRRL